jgi:hypothetical protein
MAPAESPRRTRVERGIYRQPNGNYAVCARHAGRLHFRTCSRDLKAARRAREELIAALAAGKMPASPRLRFDTVAGWWLERFEAKVAAGERHPRTLEAHRYHLEHNLLPRLASRRIAALGVEEVAAGRAALTPARRAQTGIAVREARRLGLRHVTRHPIWPPQRGPSRAHARRR